MSETDIEWCRNRDGSRGRTWNPVSGCTWKSPGCDNCYAARMTRRLEAMGQAAYSGLTTAKHFNGQIRTLPDKLDVPLRRRKPTTWFVNSMSDLFHKDVPFEFIDQVFAVMAIARRHTFQVLTKRPERMADYFRSGRRIAAVQNLVDDDDNWEEHRVDDPPLIVWPLPNIWLGTSVENQEQADKRIPHLLQTPAAVRFLSCEPLLGAVDLVHAIHHGECGSSGCAKGKVDWVIVGGESGPGARPMHPDWARGLRDQCTAAGVPFFFKQWGAYQPSVVRSASTSRSSQRYTPMPGGQFGDPLMERVGKKAAGRLLDGGEWNEMPEVAR